MKRFKLICVMVLGLILAGCGKNNTEDIQGTDTEAIQDTDTDVATADNTGNVVQPEDLSDYRMIPEELPELGDEPSAPGDRTHFSFVQGDTTYVFTETETLWLYNQSRIATMSTQFLLNVNGKKVVIVPLDGEEADSFQASDYEKVYDEEGVKIYQGKKLKEDETAKVEADTPMYLTVYDMVYKVDMWQDLVIKGSISSNRLYEGLSQMGTAIEKAGANDSLTDVLTGFRSVPVMDDYKLAYRDGVAYTGFVFCSPNTETVDHDTVAIYISAYVPEWDTYVICHIENQPDYVDRLEDTKETFDGHPIQADYTGELKYFLLGEDGRSMYLEGIPGDGSKSTKSFTAKEAAYLFELLFTE